MRICTNWWMGNLWRDGEGNPLPGPNWQHGAFSQNINRRLDPYVTQQNFGRIASNAGYGYDPARTNSVRMPGLAFIAAANLARITDPAKPVPFAPDLAIEVLSPTDVWSSVQERVTEYLAFGGQGVWVISPFERAIYVYRPDHSKDRILYTGQVFDGDDSIPGFQMPVTDVFVL